MKTVSRHQQTSGGDWKSPLGLALIGYYLAMAVVGLLIPEDILSANVWAREFSDFMASIVPQIDRITALGIKPDVNRFYFSVLWAGSPVFTLLLSMHAWRAWKNNQAAVWTTPFLRSLPPMIFIAVITLISLNPHWFFDPSMRISQFYFGSSIGRSFVAQTHVIGALFFGLGLFMWLIGWITGYIPRRIKEQKND